MKLKTNSSDVKMAVSSTNDHKGAHSEISYDQSIDADEKKVVSRLTRIMTGFSALEESQLIGRKK